MKMYKFFISCAFVLSGFSSFAQTADEIIAKHVTAMGGADKLATLQSVRMSGSMSVQGTDVGLTMTKMQDKGLRMDMEIMGTSNYQVANTSKGFVFMPVQGQAEPVAMDDETYARASTQFDVQGSLFNYKQKGGTAVYGGLEKTDDGERHLIKYTNKKGKTSNYYIDPKTFYITKITSMINVNGEEMENFSIFSDYRKNADGFMFPYTSENRNGTVTFDKIETNVKIDETIFNG